METVLCSVPVEVQGYELRRKRSEDQGFIQPKVAITSLNYRWTIDYIYLHGWNKN